jgi:hypothetical protein
LKKEAEAAGSNAIVADLRAKAAMHEHIGLKEADSATARKKYCSTEGTKTSM